jgi:hypothetical protein
MNRKENSVLLVFEILNKISTLVNDSVFIKSETQIIYFTQKE